MRQGDKQRNARASKRLAESLPEGKESVCVLELAYHCLLWARCHLAMAVALQPLTKTPTMGRTLMRKATWVDEISDGWPMEHQLTRRSL